MDIEILREICKTLPGTTENIKWENHLCFCIGEKMFLIIGLDQSPTTASFKVPDEKFEEITEQERFVPAPYLARHKWVWTKDISCIGKKEWEHYIRQSYELVKAKLPKKVRQAIEK